MMLKLLQSKSVERQSQPLIAGISDGKKAWQILRENFEPTSRERLAGLIDEFFELNYNAEEETIGIYCKRVQEKYELIKESGFEFSEELVCFQLIRKLPHDYDNLVQILYRLDKDEFTVKNIELQLGNEFGRVQQKRKDELHRNVANAYETRISRKAEGCKSLGTKSGFLLEPKIEVKHRINPSVSDVLHLDMFGEIVIRKYLHPRTVDALKEKVNNRSRNHLLFSFYSELSSKPVNPEAQCTSTSQKLGEWLIDSAATSHFCNNRDWFSTFRHVAKTEVLVEDKNCTFQVNGIGNIVLNVKDGNRNIQIELINVYYAPNMRRNLIAGANLDIAGFKVIWKNNKMVIHDEFNDHLGTVNRRGKLYILYGVHEKCISNEYNNTSTRNSINLETFHRRFGHINVNVLNYMSNHNIVKGIERIQGKLSNCDVCKTSKLTRTSMKTNYAITTKTLRARVYMDIWGPAPVKSLGGNLYFLSIIDDFSRKINVYIIKRKSEVLECFKKYLYRSERELNVNHH
ncbi:Retrovirus-related Pol polyprotein from transposon TNT 1-94 [Araneus ventricosus]|uniref:Retrovirus-related Pol polyprotein from transposon TNT 1-94 n=1 Tax=Araneus ventricosus TaxID=182803 RepID=A0A4Y2UW34_ARAVE|nr:Retrovirus-related Pol polyprotein from transposon TNT 1-94 [Araneus ventricosus]